MKIHFIGIGGIGMSGIARMHLSLGHAVQGSDLKTNEILSDLERRGAKIFIGHDASHVDGSDLVVYSSSIQENHPERQEALKKNIKVMHRAEALAELCRDKFTIAVTGTHGKTTTTSLVGMILMEALRDPSIVVGGLVNEFGGNARHGRGREIVIEADESDSSFLKFSPDIEVITNIEAEHMDHFKSMARVEDAYRKFVGVLRPGGVWIGYAEDPNVLALDRENKAEVLYGFDGQKCHLYAADIEECPEGRRGVVFDAWYRGKRLGHIGMRIIGRHNVLNALGAIAVGLKLGIPFSDIALALQKYGGAGRRFDVRYEDEKFLIVDDYAHHPTEIRKTLAAAKALDKKRIVALFQPHRFSRTDELLEDFGASFTDADKIFITDIYAANETPRPGVTGEKVSETIRRCGHKDVTFVPRASLSEVARGQMLPGDLVIMLGAGDLYQVADSLATHLKEQNPPALKTLPADTIFRSLRGKVLKNEPLSRHTSLKIGGPAAYWVEPADPEDLRECLGICREHGQKMTLFGAGSNLLVPDRGIEGAVIHLNSPYFRQIRLEGDKIVARAGVPNSIFISFAVEHGFGGCEFLLGIPGNIGGSVAMNAGSHQQSIDTFLESVTLLTFEGQQRTLKKSEIPFRYRSSGIREAFIEEAVFAFPKVPREATQKRLDEYRDYRARTQDLQYPSAGCMFKNPSISGCSSGKLIDEAGLKGFRIGGAQVSEKHANFIINRGGATAKDVLELLETVKQKVRQKFGIELETEVKILGSGSPPALLNRYLRNGGSGEKIAVLAGGPSCEREISLISGKAVFDALCAAGYSVILSDTDELFVEFLKKENATLAFIALHGSFGEDGTVQRILEESGIDYTGSGVLASEAAFDKTRTQALLKEEGICVPDFRVLKISSDVVSAEPVPFPLVVKPARAGSSVGVSILFDKKDYEKACLEAFKFSDTVLVERYISGRELTVGILGGEALPIVEIVAQRKFYDYEAKYKDCGTSYEVPAKLTDKESAAVREAALRAHRALGCQVMSRVDIILSTDGTPYVLEINTIPGLTGKSLLPKAARAAGIDFAGLCVKILTLSLERKVGVNV